MIVTSMNFRALTRNVLEGPVMAMRSFIIRNAAERTLDYMDDRMLRDIGLSRRDIDNAVRRIGKA